jgi:DNA-binding PadR family transcriptional regulator
MKELTMQEQYILLSINQLKDDAYLLNIRDHIKNATGTEFALGTIYVPLERLHRLGYLNTRVEKPAPRVGGRSTKYYSLTESGQIALSRMKKIHDRLWIGFVDASPAEPKK